MLQVPRTDTHAGVGFGDAAAVESFLLLVSTIILTGSPTWTLVESVLSWAPIWGE